MARKMKLFTLRVDGKEVELYERPSNIPAHIDVVIDADGLVYVNRETLKRVGIDTARTCPTFPDLSYKTLDDSNFYYWFEYILKAREYATNPKRTVKVHDRILSIIDVIQSTWHEEERKNV